MSLIWKMPSNLEHLNCTNKSTLYSIVADFSVVNKWTFSGFSFYLFFKLQHFTYSPYFYTVFLSLSRVLAVLERENIYGVNIIMSFMNYNFVRQFRWNIYIERWSVAVFLVQMFAKVWNDSRWCSLYSLTLFAFSSSTVICALFLFARLNRFSYSIVIPCP